MSGGAVLAASVLTLVSIWAAEPVKNLLEPKIAKINISILDGDFSHTTFMVSNTGNRPAGLSEIEIESRVKGVYKSWYLRSELDKKLLEPGKSYVLNASNGSIIPAAVPHEVQAMISENKAGAANCNMVIKYVQMSGVKEYLYKPFICSPV